MHVCSEFWVSDSEISLLPSHPSLPGSNDHHVHRMERKVGLGKRKIETWSIFSPTTSHDKIRCSWVAENMFVKILPKISDSKSCGFISRHNLQNSAMQHYFSKTYNRVCLTYMQNEYILPKIITTSVNQPIQCACHTCKWIYFTNIRTTALNSYVIRCNLTATRTCACLFRLSNSKKSRNVIKRTSLTVTR